MANSKPKVLLVCNQGIHDAYIAPVDVQRLNNFATWEWFPCKDGSSLDDVQTEKFLEDPKLYQRTVAKLGEVRQRLGSTGASARVADLAFSLMKS